MKVESDYSPLKGEEVNKKAYKSYFRRNTGTPLDLLRAHLHAALDARPERAEEFLEFYRGELSSFLEREMNLMEQNAAYIKGRKACFMGEQEFPASLPEEWRAEWTRGHADFQAWEAGMSPMQ